MQATSLTKSALGALMLLGTLMIVPGASAGGIVDCAGIVQFECTTYTPYCSPNDDGSGGCTKEIKKGYCELKIVVAGHTIDECDL